MKNSNQSFIVLSSIFLPVSNWLSLYVYSSRSALILRESNEIVDAYDIDWGNYGTQWTHKFSPSFLDFFPHFNGGNVDKIADELSEELFLKWAATFTSSHNNYAPVCLSRYDALTDSLCEGRNDPETISFRSRLHTVLDHWMLPFACVHKRILYFLFLYSKINYVILMQWNRLGATGGQVFSARTQTQNALRVQRDRPGTMRSQITM